MTGNGVGNNVGLKFSQSNSKIYQAVSLSIHYLANFEITQLKETIMIGLVWGLVFSFNHNHSYPDTPHNLQYKMDMEDRVGCYIKKVNYLLGYKFHQV